MLNYDDARQRVFKAIQQAYYQADGAKNKLSASEIADETASAAFKAMQEKYNLGMSHTNGVRTIKSQSVKSYSRPDSGTLRTYPAHTYSCILCKTITPGQYAMEKRIPHYRMRFFLLYKL